MGQKAVSVFVKEQLGEECQKTTILAWTLPAHALSNERKLLTSKRVFDTLFSAAILLLFAPLFVLIAVGIKCSSKGAIFYIQPRLGLGGRIFSCIKFRTMDLAAERTLTFLLQSNPTLKQEWETKQKLSSDPRVFPFGKFLRMTSLDELPQFWNVLKGDLSVVGPRPYMIHQRAAIGPHSAKILSIRPGITGLWQTSGRSETSFQTRILLDAAYVDKASFLFDLKLICKTLPALLSCANAY